MIKYFLILSFLSVPLSVRAETAAEFISRVQQKTSPAVTFKMLVKSPTGSIKYDCALKGRKWIMKSNVDGQDITVLFDGQQALVMMMGMAMKTSNIQNFVEIPDGEGYTLGEETVVGKLPCRMLSKPDEKVCINEEYVLPVYAESKGASMTISDIMEKALSDSEFDVPANVPVLNMSDNLQFGN